MRQAVVLIHGIGEQKPMGTVRGFVKAVLADRGKPMRPAYWSKPDEMSQLFELRLLRSRGRTSADFYEYYWAYNLQGTKLGELGRWLSGLAMRRGKDVPASARSLWLLGRLTIVLVILTLALGGGTAGYQWFGALPKLGLLSAAIVGLLLLLQSIVLAYLGDAARYLSPRPRNIKLRQTIRSECVALLKSLHESGKYDRIVVVGHSLGSVIGFDAITNLWQQYHESLPDLARPERQAEVRDCMARSSSPQPIVRDKLSEAAGALGANGAGVDEFQRCQAAAWQEQRHFGNPWRITDFITLGSPLVHAALLMADSKLDFKARCSERELLTCPPQRDKKGFAFSGTTMDAGGGKQYTPLLLHHAAAFAVTRWTNLYFPTRLGLFGDVVGGPLREVFGLGIRDVPVSTGKWHGLVGRTPMAHTSYWVSEPVDGKTVDGKAAATTASGDALTALRRALALTHKRKSDRPKSKPAKPEACSPRFP